MLETTIRLAQPGRHLCVATRRVTVSGHGVDAEILQRVCGTLRHRIGLAAVPCRNTASTLLVATGEPVEPVHLDQDTWAADIADSGEPTRRIALTDPDGPELIPMLVERALLATLARRTDLWPLDSPRIWYEPEPFLAERGVAAYRRYETGSVLLEDLGVGLSVDMGTAFFSMETLSYFFDPSVDAAERERRRCLFQDLTGRQAGQKGTLLYDNGQTRTKCYFEAAPAGMTCATTGRLKVKGCTYESLYDYYRQALPRLGIQRDAQAVVVSFQGIDRPQPVAASRVRVRIANDDVPARLSSVDKIAPVERRALLERFWARLGPSALGAVAPGLLDGFWRPDSARTFLFRLPAVLVGRGGRVPSPSELSLTAYRTHYRQRLDALNRFGCFSVPPTVTRTVFYAYRAGAHGPAARRAANDIAARLGNWTGHRITASPVEYETVSDAVAKLRTAATAGVALFVLDDEPAAYHEVAHLLPEWRIKRITERTLREQFENLIEGAWDGRTHQRDPRRGRARWESFVELNALDLLQQVEGVPFRVDDMGAYDAQLAIDVGHDRRQFALALLVAREKDKTPGFQIASHVYPKPDHQHEAVNAVLLCDGIVALVETVMRRSRDPLRSLLVLRDGQLADGETAGIDRGLELLARGGWLASGARVDLMELHKDSQKAVRFWEVGPDGSVSNPLEGHGIRLNRKMAVLATTGATLHQGTAAPLLVTGNGRCEDLIHAAEATFAAAQLNWSSPSVAQRLPLHLKRADEDLTARSAQEVRRLR